MNRENYLSDLFSQLHFRGVEETRCGEIISEVEAHLEESGENPEEAFGTARQYAERMAVFAEKKTSTLADDEYLQRTFRATAFDEVDILFKVGQEGWELTGVGPYALYCRRPLISEQTYHWEYMRRTGVNGSKILREMEAAGWMPCGQWVVFHYFKRKVQTLDLLKKSKEG